MPVRVTKASGYSSSRSGTKVASKSSRAKAIVTTPATKSAEMAPELPPAVLARLSTASVSNCSAAKPAMP